MQCFTKLRANLTASVTSQVIEDSLSIAPSNESVLFANRDKFDLVIIYDASSEVFGERTTPPQALVGAIYENEFKKMLRNVPILLVGGLEAWKRDLGEGEVVRSSVGGDYGRSSAPTPPRVNVGNGTATPPSNSAQSPLAAGVPNQFWNPPPESSDRPSFSSAGPSYPVGYHARFVLFCVLILLALINAV